MVHMFIHIGMCRCIHPHGLLMKNIKLKMKTTILNIEFMKENNNVLLSLIIIHIYFKKTAF